MTLDGFRSQVHGVGATTAAEWYARGITTIEAAVQSGLMNATQRVGARFHKDLQERIPRAEVSAIVDAVRVLARRSSRSVSLMASDDIWWRLTTSGGV